MGRLRRFWGWDCLVVILLAGIAMAVVFGLGGCGWTDPETDVPKPIREKLATPEKVPASKVATLMREYQDAVTEEARAKQSDNSRWARSKARELRELTEQIAEEGEERDADARAILDRGTQALQAFKANQKDAEDRAAAFAGKVWGVIDIGVQAAQNSGVPALPIAALLATNVLAYLLPRPKEKQKTDEAYDQGVNAGLLMDRTRVAAVHPTPSLLPASGTVVPLAAA